MNRQWEDQESEYDSSSAPSTPQNSGRNGEKKKSRGLKKLFTKKKNPDGLDKSPSLSGRGLVGDEGGGSKSRRRSFTGFFKLGSKKHESKSESYNGKTSETFSEKNEMHARNNWVDASNEETKPTKHKLDNLAAKIGEETNLLLERAVGDTQKHSHTLPTEATIDDNGKTKEHQEPDIVKEDVKHDHQHHQEQNEHPHDDLKEEKVVTIESEAVAGGRDMLSPSPPLQKKECVGCESLAKGLQHMCLPWTVNKDDH